MTFVSTWPFSVVVLKLWPFFAAVNSWCFNLFNIQRQLAVFEPFFIPEELPPLQRTSCSRGMINDACVSGAKGRRKHQAFKILLPGLQNTTINNNGRDIAIVGFTLCPVQHFMAARLLCILRALADPQDIFRQKVTDECLSRWIMCIQTTFNLAVL